MIRIFEVGPRDGLQNLPHVPSTDDKIQLIKHLRDAGLTQIEIASFVHPKAVPNMADAEQVCKSFDDKTGFSVLIPNKRGYERAVNSGMEQFNIFFSPMDSFNVANYGLNLKQIIANYAVALHGVPKESVRVYISESFEAGREELASAIQVGLKFGESSGANLATEDLVKWCKKRGIECGVTLRQLKAARKLAHKIKNPTLKVAAKNKYNETKSKLKAVWF